MVDAADDRPVHGIFAATMIVLVLPLLVRTTRSAMRRGQGEIGLNDLAMLIVCILFCRDNHEFNWDLRDFWGVSFSRRAIQRT